MKLPVLITRDTIVFPDHEVQIEVGREISIKAIKLTQNFVPDPNDADGDSLKDMILVVPQIDIHALTCVGVKTVFIPLLTAAHQRQKFLNGLF